MEMQSLTGILAEILEVDEADIEISSSLDALGWDSLSTLSFIAAVDEQFGKRVSADDLKKCETVSDLADLV